jgi:hypothetical protein
MSDGRRLKTKKNPRKERKAGTAGRLKKEGRERRRARGRTEEEEENEGERADDYLMLADRLQLSSI